MTETTSANLYDYPKYYDLIFGSDWKAEIDFLEGCFGKHSGRPVKRVFEPACGTGRLLIKFAKRGYDVCGNDLNAKAVKFCNDRFARNGFERSAVVGDMSDFKLSPKADAAFNMINSFRHLPTESAANDHFRCMADALEAGGLYVLGLHLTPDNNDLEAEEEWHAQRGRLSVISQLWTSGFDAKNRMEQLNMSFDVRTPTKQFRLVDKMAYRTYTRFQMKALLKRAAAFEILETYDFAYDLNTPVKINEATEDVVFILRKKSV